MYLDEGFSGGGHRGRSCKACKEPILKGQPVTRVEFDGDQKDMSGDYHRACGKPFESFARALSAMRRLGS